MTEPGLYHILFISAALFFTGVYGFVRHPLYLGLSLVLLWYGLYFGILGRDLAEVASEQMVSSSGAAAAAASPARKAISECKIMYAYGKMNY